LCSFGWPRRAHPDRPVAASAETAPAVHPPAPVEAPPAGPIRPVLRAPPPALAPSGPIVGASGRSRLELATLAGRLGQLGAGVELAWSSLRPEMEGIETPTGIDHERLRLETVTTRTGEGGTFTFFSEPPGAGGLDSVVWVRAPGREALPVVLTPGERSLPSALAPPARAVVRVLVRRAGVPVAGANVRHTLSFWETGQPAREKRPRRVFLREELTGPDGSVELVPGSGENLLEAWTEDERALAWRGTPEGEVVLELGPTIEIAGRVVYEGPRSALVGTRYFVGFVTAEDHSDHLWGGPSIALRPDGTFGPDRWPRAERRSLWVAVMGGEVAGTNTLVPNPPPWGRAEVELTTEVGLSFEVAVADAAGAPVVDADLFAHHWKSGAARQLTRATTDAEGRARTFAPPGELTVEVKKPGFTSWTLDGDASLHVPQVKPPLHVTLRPAGVVEGWVHVADEPVEAFSVVAWSEDGHYDMHQSFTSEEGAFRLEDVPQGASLHVLAYSDEHPQSETAVVAVGAEPHEVVLELAHPRRARGRVIDAVTREPVPNARLQHLLTGMGTFAGARGREIAVQPDGRFELGGFASGRGGFACYAAGYDNLYYSTREDEGEVIDIGLLALNPLARIALEVREEGVTDFSGYRAWNMAISDSEPRTLTPDGRATLPSRSGLYEVHVTRPDGVEATRRGNVLPGAETAVVIDFAGGIELTVGLAEPPSQVERWTLRAFTSAALETATADASWSAERRAFVLRGLQPGDVVLELRDGERAQVVQRSFRLGPAPRQSLELALGGELRRVRLVDPRGRPWAACAVTVALDDESGWFAQRETDAEGELELGPLEARRLVLSAKLANESIAYGVPIELEPDLARTTTVELDVGPRSLLVLGELGRPVAGLCVLYQAKSGPRHLSFGYISDEAGHVRGPFLGPGHYVVGVNHRDYWPTRHALARSSAGSPVALELFSRATLTLAVTLQDGRSVPGARIALEHAELAATAEDWLAAQLLEAPNGLVSDAHGALVLNGLPRGTYSWSCTSPGLRAASGRLVLAPGERAVLPIRLLSE
jgi:hypothetical protein